MNLVYKVRRVAHAHQGTPRVDVVLPTIQFFIVLEGEEDAFVLCFQQETVRLQVRSFDVCYVREVNNCLMLCG